MSHYVQDYTKAQDQRKLLQSMLPTALQQYKRAGPGTALSQILSSYFLKQGMDKSNIGMDEAVTGRDNQNRSDMAAAMGAYRGDTPYQQSDAETFPGESPIPGLTNHGTGMNPNAMAQSMMGAHDPNTQKLGIASLLGTGKSATSPMKNLAQRDQLVAARDSAASGGATPEQLKRYDQQIAVFDAYVRANRIVDVGGVGYSSSATTNAMTPLTTIDEVVSNESKVAWNVKFSPKLKKVL